MTTIEPQEEQINRFVTFLTNRQGPSGRAYMAQLRRAALDLEKVSGMIWLLGDKLPDVDEFKVEAYSLVAALFAIHAPYLWKDGGRLRNPTFSKDEQRRTLGASLRRLRDQVRNNEDARKTFDMRVKALIDCEREDLAIPLRGMIQRIATADRFIPIDYARLVHDLMRWDDDDEIRRTWSREYWSRNVPEAKPINQSPRADNQISNA